jgi:hypothetical protein
MGTYDSLLKLIATARDKAMTRSPDVLEEAQLVKLLEDFDRLMAAQTRVADRVFWIKGVYKIPPAIAARFATFVKTGSESKAVERTPSGRPAKWLVVVTGRMSGFSVSFLKEAVTEIDVGDVYEAAEPESKHLFPKISVGGFVARLKVTWDKVQERERGPGAAAPPPAGAVVSGELVLNAQDVFAQRGYVFSKESAEGLLEHLKWVSNLWNSEGAMTSRAIGDLSEKIRKPGLTLLDVLQNSDAFPKLPRMTPESVRRPLANISVPDGRETRDFVTRYRAGVEKLIQTIKNLAKPDAGCSLFFVPEDSLFGKS